MFWIAKADNENIFDLGRFYGWHFIPSHGIRENLVILSVLFCQVSPLLSVFPEYWILVQAWANVLFKPGRHQTASRAPPPFIPLLLRNK